MTEQPFEESAKAVQEVARTATAAIEAAEKAGGFFAKYVDGPLEQLIGGLEDKLRFRRATNFMKLQAKFKAEMDARGANAAVRTPPLNFVYPAFQEATLVDDDSVLDLWARLLANSANPSTGVSPRRGYVSMLKEMSPFDAKVFEAIYSVLPDDGVKKAVLTHLLPQRAVDAAGHDAGAKPPARSQEVAVSLSNLERIGAIGFGTAWGGGEVFDIVNQSTLGYELYKAIRARRR